MKWVYHEREARVLYSMTTDRQPVIYTCKQNSISIQTAEKRNLAINFDCYRGV